MNRRGFLKGLMTAVAVVAIEVKLSSGEPALQERSLSWSEINDRYDYGIDRKNPLDVAIYDKRAEEMVEPHELMSRWHEAPNPNDYGDQYDEAYEATAIISITQGSLLFHQGVDRSVMIPAYAEWALARNREHEEGLPWIVTAAA